MFFLDVCFFGDERHSYCNTDIFFHEILWRIGKKIGIPRWKFIWRIDSLIEARWTGERAGGEWETFSVGIVLHEGCARGLWWLIGLEAFFVVDVFWDHKYIWQYKRVKKNTEHNGLPNNQRLFTALVSAIGQWSKLQMLVQIGCLLRDACQAKQTETFTDRWWLQPLFLRLLGGIPWEAHEGACCRDCFQCEPWMGSKEPPRSFQNHYI